MNFTNIFTFYQSMQVTMKRLIMVQKNYYKDMCYGNSNLKIDIDNKNTFS